MWYKVKGNELFLSENTLQEKKGMKMSGERLAFNSWEEIFKMIKC